MEKAGIVSSKGYLSSNLGMGTRLGNNMFELSSLLGIARSLNRTAVFFIENAFNKNELENMINTFPGLIEQFYVVYGARPSTIRDTVFHTRCCIFEDPRVLQNIDDEHIHLTGTLYQSYKYFPNMRDEHLKWIRKPTNDFEGLPKSDGSTHITCVHTRRGDFIGVGFQASDTHFIREAVKYIENKEKTDKPRKKVVIFGDDLNFMENLFNGSVLSIDENAKISNSTYFISQNSPSDDIVYSKSNCHVVLISASHSTFGWWIGYISVGNKAYYMDMRVEYVGALRAGNIHIHDYFLPHWIPLKFAADNSTIVVGDKVI